MTRNELKFIKSLQDKKTRKQHGLYLAEGIKICEEIIRDKAPIAHLLFSERFDIQGLISYPFDHLPYSILKESDYQALSCMEQAPGILIVGKSTENPSLQPEASSWSLYLDGIRDPGNLGTIIRMSEWFGISKIFLSPDSVEWYNPKTIQSSMGSYLRIAHRYISTEDASSFWKNTLPKYGADLNGQNLYQISWPKGGLLCIGSESHGLSKECLSKIQHQIHIPADKRAKAESLNAAMASSIILSEIFRNQHFNA